MLIGHKVIITDPGATYDAFEEMANVLYAKNWQKLYLPNKGDSGIIINKYIDKFRIYEYYLIKLNNNIDIIMGKGGFKVVESILPDELFEI